MAVRIHHTTMSPGTAMTAVASGYRGQGTEAEIRVRFPKVGDKRFILEWVKLTPC